MPTMNNVAAYVRVIIAGSTRQVTVPDCVPRWVGLRFFFHATPEASAEISSSRPLPDPLSDAELQYLPYHLRVMLSIIEE